MALLRTTASDGSELPLFMVARETSDSDFDNVAKLEKIEMECEDSE
jgi:hypothetical protein